MQIGWVHVRLNNRLGYHRDEAISLAFSPDGKILASGGGYDDKSVRLWSLENFVLLGSPLRIHRSYVNSLCFSPDGKILASGGGKEILLLSVVDRHTICQPLLGHTSQIKSLSYSPDGKILASGSWDKTIRLWSTEKYGQMGQPLGSVCFSPDGKTLVSVSKDNTVRFWSMANQEISDKSFSQNKDEITTYNVLSFSQDGRRLIIAGGTHLNFISIDKQFLMSKQLVGSIHSYGIHSLCHNKDSQSILFGKSELEAFLWWSIDRQVVIQTAHNQGVCYSLCFSNDGRILASGSKNAIHLWTMEDKLTKVSSLSGHASSITSVCFSPNDKILASASEDKTVRLWLLEQNALLCDPLVGHTSEVMSVDFSPNGKTLASGSKDKTIRLWSIETHSAVGQPLIGHTDGVRSVCFIHDGRILVSGGGQTIHIWDLSTYTCLRIAYWGADEILCIKFSHDYRYLAFTAGTNAGLLENTNSVEFPYYYRLVWCIGAFSLIANGAILNEATGLSNEKFRLLTQLGAINNEEKYHDVNIPKKKSISIPLPEDNKITEYCDNSILPDLQTQKTSADKTLETEVIKKPTQSTSPDQNTTQNTFYTSITPSSPTLYKPSLDSQSKKDKKPNSSDNKKADKDNINNNTTEKEKCSLM